MSNSHDDDDVHKDLTRLEDLSEFLHEEDTELENKFDDFKDGSKKTNPINLQESVEENEELPSIDDLDNIENNEFSSDTLSNFGDQESSFEQSSTEIDNEELSNEEVSSFNLDELDEKIEEIEELKTEEEENDSDPSALLENDSFFRRRDFVIK